MLRKYIHITGLDVCSKIKAKLNLFLDDMIKIKDEFRRDHEEMKEY